MNKVKAGDKFQVKASDWNDIADAVNYVKSLQNANGTAKNKNSMPSTCVYVKNTSVSGYSFFSAVPVGDFIGNPDDKGGVMLFSSGIATNSQFGIAQEPIAPNAVGKVMLIGVTPASVTVSNQDHKFAVHGSDGKLISAESGNARILWAGEADAETGESYCVLLLGMSAGTSTSASEFEYEGPFKVAIINKALANPPEGGWTPENMPSPNYKICVYDGCIADDVALNSKTSDLQAGYAQYNGVYLMCQGKEFALPKANKYIVLTIDANLESETYTRDFELVNEVTCKNNELKQQFPIAYISYVAPPTPPEGSDPLTPAQQAEIDANAHSIKQYFHNVPQLWSFKVCADPEPTGE